MMAMQMRGRNEGVGEEENNESSTETDETFICTMNSLPRHEGKRRKSPEWWWEEMVVNLKFGKRKSDNVSLTAMLSLSLVLHERASLRGQRWGGGPKGQPAKLSSALKSGRRSKLPLAVGTTIRLNRYAIARSCRFRQGMASCTAV